MLKQLKITKAIEIKRQHLESLETKAADIKKRNETTQAALAEAKTVDDLNLLESEINEIVQESADLEAEMKNVEKEISDLQQELDDVKDRAAESSKKNQTREKGAGESMNRLQVRELLKTGEYYKQSDVIEFYEKFKNLRAVTGGELTIPEIVVNRIMDVIGDYSTLYPIVDRIRVQGTARILIDTDTTPAAWVEQGGAFVPDDAGTIASVDFDGFKVGKVTFVDNYLLQDSVINLDEYVTKKIARAIGLALDIAILNGNGAPGRQPTGIIPTLPPTNAVTVPEGSRLVDLLKPIGLVDTGVDNVGEITAVMTRATYFAHFLQYSINVNDEGNQVGKLPNLTRPDLVGIPVVFNNAMPPHAVLYGEFDKYTLVERESITVDSSEHIRFVEDQMAFRGKGRFDGKPTKPEAFALVTIVPGAPEV